MKRSTDRILTTHVGSLPRPDDLFALMLSKMDGKPFDEQAYAHRLQGAVKDIVRWQVELGIDIVNDGEMGKPSFITYVGERLSGLEKREGERPSPFARSREVDLVPRVLPVGAGGAGEREPPARAHGLRVTYAVQRPEADCDRAREPQGRARRRGGGRGLRAVDCAVERRGDPAERILPERRGLSDRRRRRHARGVQGDRRRRLPPADRRSVPRVLLHHAAGPRHRGAAASGRKRASRRSITRSPAFRKTASASTPATASTWARASTTWSSRTSSTSS